MSETSFQVLNFTQVYIQILFLVHHFLFLTVKFTDLSLKMSRTVKKSPKRKIQYLFAFWSAILDPPFVIFELYAQIRNQWPQKFLCTISSSIYSYTVYILVSHIGTAISYLFIYFQFRFVITIFKNPQLPNIKYIRSNERCTSMLQGDNKTSQIYKCFLTTL